MVTLKGQVVTGGKDEYLKRFAKIHFQTDLVEGFFSPVSRENSGFCD